MEQEERIRAGDSAAQLSLEMSETLSETATKFTQEATEAEIRKKSALAAADAADARAAAAEARIAAVEALDLRLRRM